MPGTFNERMQELIDNVGKGHLTGTVVVDQVYAQYQHEGLDLKHPRGGRAKYLGGPLIENHVRYLHNIANGLLKDGGELAMKQSMEHLSAQVESEAPREFNDLRYSGHPIVESNEQPVYDRPPAQHRLTDAELRAKNQLRAAGG